MASLRTRHGRRLDPLSAAFRALRRATRPLRDRLRIARRTAEVQRSVPLLPGDVSSKRKRYHVLVDLLHEHAPDRDLVVVDVGTFQGHTAAHLHTYCPRAKIYAVDIEPPAPERDQITGLARVEFLHGTSEHCATRFQDATLDLVFIDADHSAEQVRRDLQAWVPKVKAGGLITGHDYASRRHPEVKPTVDAFFADHAHRIRVEADKVWWTLR